MIKQFKLSDFNGLYLTHIPSVAVNSSNYLSQMFKDNDFFPKNANDAGRNVFKNSAYVAPGIIIGSNALSSSNSALTHTEITNPNQLIMNEVYYNTFTMYFNFKGSRLFGYTPNSSISGTDFSKYLNRLRIKLYAQLGTNMVPLNLSSLAFYHVDDDTFHYVTGTTHYNSTHLEGFKISTGNNAEPCIDLGYGTTTGITPSDIYGAYTTYAQYFDGYSNANPNGFYFKVTASIPDFARTAQNTRDYKLIIKYYNIGTTGTTLTYPYNTSEAVELMSNIYPWFQVITTIPAESESVVPLGGVSDGGGTGGSGGGGGTVVITGGGSGGVIRGGGTH